MKKLLVLIPLISACHGYKALNVKLPKLGDAPAAPVVDSNTYFPVASAVINVSAIGDLSVMKKDKQFNIADIIIPKAYAQVAQGSATVNVVYANPSATTFTINTSQLGNAVTVLGDDLNLGSVSVSGLDDNTLNVCTGVGAPANKCNRLYIRVYTLGTATGGITGVAGFINTTYSYGINMFAGTAITPLGFNASPTASTVTNAATVHTHTIPNGVNRVRLSQLTIPVVPIKADLSNAGSGNYEVNLVVQYALGYQP